jgi:ABC-type multidrug transport system fused ATPase/permease subunit
MFFGIMWMVSQAVLPAAVGRTIDAGVTTKNSAELIRWALVVVGLALAKAASGILRHRNALSNFLAAAYTTVQVITRKTVALGATLPKRVAAGDVVAVGTSDINEIGHALDITARLTGAIVAIGTVAAIMLAESVPLGLIVLIGVPVLTGLTGLLLKPLHDRQRTYRVLQGELTGRAVDIAAGLRVLRGIGGEPAFAGRYRRESQELRHAAFAVTRVESGLAAAEIMLPGLITAGVTFVAARFALDGHLTIGQLVAFYGYATFLAAPLRTLMEGADLITRGHVAARRVVRILNVEPGIRDVEGAGGTEGAVLVSGRGSTLVDEESGLEVEAGELFAVACAEPAEADLLAERLARFEDSGRPMLGDVPLREMPLRQVRERILLARNSDKFFNGGLRSELDPTGRRADEEIRTAIRVASAQDILDALPEGLDTEMTDGGREFSGGQLQRLRLVRALLARREVTVLVEPTSAVDAHTEARIAVRLAESHAPATRGAALVAVHAGTVVAMKVSSLSSHVAAVGIEAEPQTTTILFTTSPLLLDSAHRVAYVEDGRVVAVGTHRELLASEPRYAAVVTRGEDIEEAA